MKIICIVGAESTGKTTLAKDLAKHYKTLWVPEYGREYSEKFKVMNDKWETSEFIDIAKRQNILEDEAVKRANKVLICDTNSFATTLWHERYVGFESEEVKKEAADRKYDLYILADVNIPFVQDGTRDGEQIRPSMHLRFVEELNKKNEPMVLVSGSKKARLTQAVKAINNI